MTNGTITKNILAAAKTLTGSVLLGRAKSLMRSFPLSSEKLLYDSDAPKVSKENWAILLQAAVETDKEKLVDCNMLLAEAGLTLDTEYGRYKETK
jgi:hypothetical protein